VSSSDENGKVEYKDDALIASLPGDLRRIAEVAGVEAAVRIAREFKGTYVYIPRLSELIRQARDLRIRADYDRGIPVRRIALKHGLTQRGVRKILNRPSPEVSNPLVFSLLDE
jgi:Mor family transcriptional regulator